MPPKRGNSRVKKHVHGNCSCKEEDPRAVPNYDDLVAEEDRVVWRESEHKWCPRTGSRILVSGASGSGKTNSVMKLVMDPECIQYDKLYVFAKMIDEPKYKMLKREMEERRKGLSERLDMNIPLSKIFEQHDNLDEMPQPKDLAKDGLQYCMIVDDFQNETNPENLKKLKEYAIYGRKLGVTTIYIYQDYFKTPGVVRDNATHVMLYNPPNKARMNELAKAYADVMEFSEFRKMFKSACRNPYQFLMIDTQCPFHRINQKYSQGFGNYAQIENDNDI